MTTPSPTALDRGRAPAPLSVAPMMDRTDRHYRYFMRQITRHTLLYTEMITTAALMHGDPKRFLAFSAIEKAPGPATRRRRPGGAGALRAAGRGLGI